MTARWSPATVSAAIQARLEGYDALLTFDRDGVSGHTNHRDVHAGAQMALQGARTPLYELVSLPLLRKYSGLLAALGPVRRGELVAVAADAPAKSWQAMQAHASQLVWYRVLYLGLSAYCHVNYLRCSSGGPP